MAKITFELVSPERLLMSVPVDSAALPGAEGDFGVLPGHAPLISTLRPGVIEIEGVEGENPAGDTRIFVAGGFAEVVDDRLTVLAEEAIPVQDLRRDQIEQQIADTKEDLEDATTDTARLAAQMKLQHLNDMMSVISA